jgi:hypothetical protein
MQKFMHEWSASRPGRFIPGEKVPSTHWLGGWLSPELVWTFATPRLSNKSTIDFISRLIQFRSGVCEKLKALFSFY